MQNDCAFLCYWPYKQRQDNNSFDGNYNIGARVIMDVLARRGIECGFCTPETAKDYRVVFVSFTSDYDCLAFYTAVSLLKSWQPGTRNFVVVGGGEGMQNPTVIRNYVDYAVFGRAEYNTLRINGKLDHLKNKPCANCGKPANTIDHIIPLSRGGTNDLENLQPMCWKCNKAKGSKQ
jgi:hypothetical protein